MAYCEANDLSLAELVRGAVEDKLVQAPVYTGDAEASPVPVAPPDRASMLAAVGVGTDGGQSEHGSGVTHDVVKSPRGSLPPAPVNAPLPPDTDGD